MLLKNPKMFWYMFFVWSKKVALTKFTHIVKKPSHYAKKYVEPDYVGNQMIKDLINRGAPFAVGRPGATEIALFLQAMMLENGLRSPATDEEYHMAYVNTGIFPRTVEFVRKYAPYASAALKECDLLNVSYCVMEDYIYSEYMKEDAQLTYIRALDYWRFEEPWTTALKGKKVLVISPFSETIKKQYQRREKLYKNPDVLPDFELHTIKAVQTGGMESDDRFKDWFEALDYMYEEAMKTDFEIAILSCGAYSLPLATRFKAAGKGAIHMGGVCQMLFGIKGRRFEDEPGASDFFNEYWVYPSAEETPRSAKTVENSAYWSRENNDR